jgi:hypothetical protein
MLMYLTLILMLLLLIFFVIYVIFTTPSFSPLAQMFLLRTPFPDTLNYHNQQYVNTVNTACIVDKKNLSITLATHFDSDSSYSDKLDKSDQLD